MTRSKNFLGVSNTGAPQRLPSPSPGRPAEASALRADLPLIDAASALSRRPSPSPSPSPAPGAGRAAPRAGLPPGATPVLKESQQWQAVVDALDCGAGMEQALKDVPLALKPDFIRALAVQAEKKVLDGHSATSLAVQWQLKDPAQVLRLQTLAAGNPAFQDVANGKLLPFAQRDRGISNPIVLGWLSFSAAMERVLRGHDVESTRLCTGLNNQEGIYIVQFVASRRHATAGLLKGQSAANMKEMYKIDNQAACQWLDNFSGLVHAKTDQERADIDWQMRNIAEPALANPQSGSADDFNAFLRQTGLTEPLCINWLETQWAVQRIFNGGNVLKVVEQSGPAVASAANTLAHIAATGPALHRVLCGDAAEKVCADLGLNQNMIGYLTERQTTALSWTEQALNPPPVARQPTDGESEANKAALLEGHLFADTVLIKMPEDAVLALPAPPLRA